jgi:hypothetical protein
MRIVCALDVHRSQITYLTVEVGNGEVSRGRISRRLVGRCAPGLRSCTVSMMCSSRSMARRGGGSWSRRSSVPVIVAPGRPGRDGGQAGAQAAGENRPGRLRAAVAAAADARAAGVVDPAGADPGAAHACAAAQDADRRAHRLAAAAAGAAVPPASAGGAAAAHPRRSRGAGCRSPASFAAAPNQPREQHPIDHLVAGLAVRAPSYGWAPARKRNLPHPTAEKEMTPTPDLTTQTNLDHRARPQVRLHP